MRARVARPGDTPLTHAPAPQLVVPSHPGPLLLVHLLTAGEPGTADRHIATLPLLVLPEAACEEVGSRRWGRRAAMVGGAHPAWRSACWCAHPAATLVRLPCRSATCGPP